MKSMKILCAAMAGAVMVTAVSACGTGTAPTVIPETTTIVAETTTEKPAETTKEETTTEAETTTAAETTAKQNEVYKSSEIKVLGRLYQLEKSGTPTVSAVTIKAIPAGNTQEINSLPALSDGIRCIFDQDSFITINPTCPFDHNMKITIVPHQSKASYYDKNFLKKKAKKFTTLELCDDNVGYPTAAFSLDKKIYKTGNYDIVFLKGKTPVAVFMIKIYGNGGIKKTNTDPVELMKSEIEKSAKATTAKKKKKK